MCLPSFATGRMAPALAFDGSVRIKCEMLCEEMGEQFAMLLPQATRVNRRRATATTRRETARLWYPRNQSFSRAEKFSTQQDLMVGHPTVPSHIQHSMTKIST